MLGYVRSGSKVLYDAEVWLNASDIFSHHVLIPATTGRGKSNLMKCILYGLLQDNEVGTLVLDAHDEYYGRLNNGLSVHPKARNNLIYYTNNNTPRTAKPLKISTTSTNPNNLFGIVDLTDAQEQMIVDYV